MLSFRASNRDKNIPLQYAYIRTFKMAVQNGGSLRNGAVKAISRLNLEFFTSLFSLTAFKIAASIVKSMALGLEIRSNLNIFSNFRQKLPDVDTCGSWEQTADGHSASVNWKFRHFSFRWKWRIVIIQIEWHVILFFDQLLPWDPILETFLIFLNRVRLINFASISYRNK
jgi:hypothetical protein